MASQGFPMEALFLLVASHCLPLPGTLAASSRDLPPSYRAYLRTPAIAHLLPGLPFPCRSVPLSAAPAMTFSSQLCSLKPFSERWVLPILSPEVPPPQARKKLIVAQMGLIDQGWLAQGPLAIKGQASLFHMPFLPRTPGTN